MIKMYTADKETGTLIDEVKSIEEGLNLIKEYELEDKENDCFSEDFYDVVDEEHCTLIY